MVSLSNNNFLLSFDNYNIWYDKREIYTGSWEGGRPHGWGTYFWFHPSYWPANEDGTITKELLDNHGAEFKANRYEGLWEQGKRNGFGTFHYMDGARYVGSWLNNLKHGRVGCVALALHLCLLCSLRENTYTQMEKFSMEHLLMTSQLELTDLLLQGKLATTKMYSFLQNLFLFTSI